MTELIPAPKKPKELVLGSVTLTLPKLITDEGRSATKRFITGGVLSANPASAVRGPRYSTKKGTTPILMADDAKALIRSIPTDTLSGLRDRAIIATMIYSFARVSATLGISPGSQLPGICNPKQIYSSKRS